MTKKIAIKVEYKDKVYMSEFDKIEPTQEKEMIDFVKAAASGELSHMTFTIHKIMKKSKVYFPEKILKESIISLVYKKSIF